MPTTVPLHNMDLRYMFTELHCKEETSARKMLSEYYKLAPRPLARCSGTPDRYHKGCVPGKLLRSSASCAQRNLTLNWIHDHRTLTTNTIILREQTLASRPLEERIPASLQTNQMPPRHWSEGDRSSVARGRLPSGALEPSRLKAQGLSHKAHPLN